MSTSFSYPCLRDFYKSLGRFDAICGYATVAVDFFTEEYEQKQDGFDWVTRYSKGHGVTLHDVHFDSLSPRLAEMFILLVHAQFEEYIRKFLLEYHAANKWEKRTSEQSLLEYTMKNLKLTKSSGGAKDRECIEYYHLVRNKISHSNIKNKKLENKRVKVRKLLGVTENTFPPKAIGELDYGDFDLYTRAAKSYAATICKAARPSDIELANLIMPEIKNLNRLRNKPDRFRNAVRQVLYMKYQLDKNESDHIINKL